MDFASLQGSATFSSIGFTWMPGFHCGADQTFLIEYRSEGHEWKEGARLFGGKVLNQQLRKVVDGLDPGSPYLFRIYASNKFGQSEKSEEILANTIEGQTSESNYCISVSQLHSKELIALYDFSGAEFNTFVKFRSNFLM